MTLWNVSIWNDFPYVLCLSDHFSSYSSVCQDKFDGLTRYIFHYGVPEEVTLYDRSGVYVTCRHDVGGLVIKNKIISWTKNNKEREVVDSE